MMCKGPQTFIKGFIEARILINNNNNINKNKPMKHHYASCVSHVFSITVFL